MTKRYFMFAHPRAEVDLRTLKARNQWKGKYRHYRLLRQAANPIMEMTPRQIMEWIELPKDDWTLTTFENVRFTSTCSECEPAPNKVIPVNYDGECVACGRLLRSGLPFPMRNPETMREAIGRAGCCGNYTELFGSDGSNTSLFEIGPKGGPNGWRAWLARKLIKAARWLAPRDHGVLSDSMEEAILDAAKYGTGIVRSERINPYDFSKGFDFLK
jgi:hypothetical protein